MQHVLPSIEGWSTIRQYKDSTSRSRTSRRSSVSSTDASEYSTFSQASNASSATSASTASSVSVRDGTGIPPTSSSFSIGNKHLLNSIQQPENAECQSSSSQSSEGPLSEKFLESLDLGHPTGTSYISRPSYLSNPACVQNPTLPQQNPRRTCTSRSWSRPTLTRQEDRRLDFVEHLVDSATQLVALIWPNSAVSTSCKNRKTGNGVIPLRIFIRETLRRSRTSYSTLQVTLYYLVLIKNKGVLPECQSSDDASSESTSTRALQCGRRMFLAGLILASKYLQDRNFSARAWSKISGLPVKEINFNEMAFLDAIGWKLYIKVSDFNEWSNKVSECTDAAQRGLDCPWTDVLNNEPLISDKTCSMFNSPVSPVENAKVPASFDAFNPVARVRDAASMSAPSSRRPSWAPRQPSSENLSLSSRSSTPATLEPQCQVAPPAPSNLGRNLCTPQFTPSSASSNLSTPAESIHGHFSACIPALPNTFSSRTNCVSWLSRRSSASSRSSQCPVMSGYSGASQRWTYPTVPATTAQTSRLQDLCIEKTPSLVTSPRSITSSEDQNSVRSGGVEPLDVMAGYPSPPMSDDGPISPTRSETSRLYLRSAGDATSMSKANFLPPPLPSFSSSHQPSLLGLMMQRTSSASSTTSTTSSTRSNSNTPTPASFSASSQSRGLKRRSDDDDYFTSSSGNKYAKTTTVYN